MKILSYVIDQQVVPFLNQDCYLMGIGNCFFFASFKEFNSCFFSSSVIIF